MDKDIYYWNGLYLRFGAQDKVYKQINGAWLLSQVKSEKLRQRIKSHKMANKHNSEFYILDSKDD